jgi:uncharacterized coiled-coil protein SlyX
MLKRPVVSLFHSLKSKGMRYYWVPPNPDDINKISLLKQKYDIKASETKDIFTSLQELIETQESNIKDLNTQLTNQEKVIQKIYDKLETMDKYAYDSRMLQVFSLGYIFVILFKT